MFATPSSSYTRRSASPSPGLQARRSSTPPPRSASARRLSFSSCSPGSNYTYAPAPPIPYASPPARPPSPQGSLNRSSSSSRPRYVPAAPLPTYRSPSPTPAGRRGSFNSPLPPLLGRGGPSWGDEKLEVYGDSYVGVFTLLPRACRVTKYKGASAKGLNNSNSVLGVGHKVAQQIAASQARDVLLQFGNVDLAINYLWQLKARGPAALKPSEWVRTATREYSEYISTKLLPTLKAGKRIYVAGVMPPVVEDRYLELSIQKYTEKENVGPLPPLSQAYHAHDYRTRTAMVKAYNQIMKAFCSRYPLQLTYVDINDHLGDGERVKPAFIDREDPTNIHLLWETTLQLWCNEIPALQGRNTRDPAKLENSLELFHAEKRGRMLQNQITRGLVSV